MIHPRPSLKMQGSRKLGASLQGLNGTMHGSSNLRVRYYEDARDSGLWRFRVWAKPLLIRPARRFRRQTHSSCQNVRVHPG